MSSLASGSSPNVLGSRLSPSGLAVAARGAMCMAWRGRGDGIWISTSSNNGKTWSPQTRLFDRSTSGAPALTALGDGFLMAWRGPGEDGRIWVSTSHEGLWWTEQQPLSDRATPDDPSLASSGGLAVMAWRDASQHVWVSTSTDGHSWSPPRELADRATLEVPALAGAQLPGGDRLFTMVWRGTDGRSLQVSTSSDGLTWSEPKLLLDREARSAPGLTFLTRPGLFYMAWWDAQDCLRVSFSRDGLAWGPQLELTDWEAECGPIALTPSDTLYLACQWSTCFGGAALLR